MREWIAQLEVAEPQAPQAAQVQAEPPARKSFTSAEAAACAGVVVFVLLVALRPPFCETTAAKDRLYERNPFHWGLAFSISAAVSVVTFCVLEYETV